MKNQYVADINDFRKYGLLRCLLGGGELSLLCCWMLTPDDGSTDGNKTRYLRDPDRWRGHDPQLFDALSGLLADSESARGVQQVEDAGILPRTTFVSHAIQDSAEFRAEYFDEVYDRAEGRDLTFFDPDNGLEIKSKTRGHRASSKYLFWDEVAETFRRGSSVLLYQHYPRKKRGPFTATMARRLRRETGASWTASFATSHVLFLLAPQPRHEAALAEGCRVAQEWWREQFMIRLRRRT